MLLPNKQMIQFDHLREANHPNPKDHLAIAYLLHYSFHSNFFLSILSILHFYHFDYFNFYFLLFIQITLNFLVKAFEIIHPNHFN